jgi:hypothetical protein
MINLGNYKGFATIKSDVSSETRMVHMYCSLNDIPHLRLSVKEPCPKEYVPSGSVEWCLKLLGKPVIPDYYPEWLNQYLYRKVWKSNEWITGRKLFVKPADRHKRFTGFITHGTWSKKKKPPYWYSEIIHFTNEWRYYVSKGKILCAEWYWGDDVNTPPAPELNIKIPTEYYGTLDFGTLYTGEMALVESHDPFACGWYGNRENYAYLQWLVDGWKYMQNKID